MDVIGKWTGTIIFGKNYREHQNKALYFDLELTQNNEFITGKATDTGGIGVNPDPALINGKIVADKIQFIKQYESRHYFDNSGNVIIDKSKKGPEISYKGTYNAVDQTFYGNWKIVVKVKIFGIVPILIENGTGTWRMKRK